MQLSYIFKFWNSDGKNNNLLLSGFLKTNVLIRYINHTKDKDQKQSNLSGRTPGYAIKTGGARRVTFTLEQK